MFPPVPTPTSNSRAATWQPPPANPPLQPPTHRSPLGGVREALQPLPESFNQDPACARPANQTKEVEAELTRLEQRRAELEGELWRVQGHSKTAAQKRRLAGLEREMEELVPHINHVRLQRKQQVEWNEQNAWAPSGIPNERAQGILDFGVRY